MSEATILLVEDDKLQAEITKDYLVKYGYKVLIAVDGKSAIKTLSSQNVDLVLLDVVLPDISGYDVCRWIKVNDSTRFLPVIMLTIKGSTKDKVEGLRIGADDYLPKPYNEIELNARIYASLRVKSLRDELIRKNQQLEEVLTKLEKIAITDPLTGLFNRRYFESVIEKEYNKTVRYKTPTSCLVIDIDYFKRINDNYGHRKGDEVLKEIARLIKDCLRKVDTIARWGGEEFVILMPGTDSQKAYVAAERIKDTIEKNSFSGINEKITISIGISSIPSEYIDSAEKFIDTADNALYEAKAKGRNLIVIAD
jgi:diguanylate cyclase (GGDEF)-like protein